MTAIETHDLGVALGGLPILKDVSFTIPDGQRVGLLGANGSGKTTLIRALLGLTPHQKGTVSLLGAPPGRFRAWRELGYVPQRASISLHATTVWEVVVSGTLANRPVGWGRRGQNRLVGDALEAVGLADQAKELYVHLSGGQQQRVLIARGIVNHPRLIIMDEPFAGVDLATQADIATMLGALDATFLVVLHETEAMAGLLDRTLILRQGRLVHDGPPDDSGTAPPHEATRTTPVPLLTGIESPWTS